MHYSNPPILQAVFHYFQGNPIKSQLKKRLILGLIITLLSVTGLAAQTVTAPTYPPINSFLWGNTAVNAVGKTSFVSGAGFPYRYILPKNFDPNTKYAAIIYLHGAGECGTDGNIHLAAGNNTAHGALALVSTANPDNQTNYPCFFIAPQTPSTTVGWSSDTAASAIQALLTTFETQYPNAFDTTRIYLTGSSMGGMGTYDIPYLLSKSNHLGANPFAAIAPMSGNFNAGRSASTQPRIPIWTFHGAADPTVPIANSDDVDVPALRALGYSVTYSRYTNGTHDIWEVAYQHPLLIQWLFSQQLGVSADGPGNFDITDVAQTTASTLTVSGTASPQIGLTAVTASNATTGQSGAASGSTAPTWTVSNIPVPTSGTSLIQVTGQAPNNTAVVNGVAVNYGGTMTANLPYVAVPAAPVAPVASSSNLALNKPVTASSVSGTGLEAVNAVDGNSTTRWSSAYSDLQWITVDLGANYDISEVDLNWETACGKDYLIQTSTDGIAWTTQTTITGNTTSGLHCYPYTSATLPEGRYIRIYGTARATAWGYSLYEISVYGGISSATPAIALPNVALNKTVKVSSMDTPLRSGNLAVDGNGTTRWSSAYSDAQWIVVDLGTSYKISKVALNWETACGKNYQIQTSADGTNWTTQTTVTGNTATGLLTYTYASTPSARYVRMNGTARATKWGYSLYEFSVYGQ